MRRLLALVVVPLALGVAPARAAEIVITATAIEPEVLHVPTGTRVDFRNRTQRTVHEEFGVDPRQHRVLQLPTTGPIWAIFHRPGTHPYAVHIWNDRLPTTLAGVIELVDDPKNPPKSSTCGVVVEGNCIER